MRGVTVLPSLRKTTVVAVLCLLATAACGGGADQQEADSGAGGGGGGGGGETSSPIDVALVVPLSGAAAIPKIYVDPAEMAVEHINDAGGVDGRTVELDKIDSGFTPQSGITAVNKAIGDGADVIVGLPITSQILAVRKIVTKAQIPLLQLSISSESDYLGEDDPDGASKYSFRIGDTTSMQAKAAATFAVESLKADQVGILSDTDGVKSVQAAVEKGAASAGGSVGTTRTFPTAPKDLTNEVLAMKGMGAVINSTYPNTTALAVKQMIQNDVRIPTVGLQSATLVYANELIPADMLQYLYATSPCLPVQDDRDYVQEWVKEFKSTFGWTPDHNPALTYDAIQIFAHVVEKAGDDPAAQLDSLEDLNYTEGICGKEYQTDDHHTTLHQAVLMSFDSFDSPPTLEKHYDYGPEEG